MQDYNDNDDAQDVCTCPSVEEHTCPYEEECAGEYEELSVCKCCDHCTAQCAYDI